MCRKPGVTSECEERETLETAFRNASQTARKDAQRALEQWKNKHAAPSWDKAWKEYKDWKSTERLIDALDLNIAREKRVTEPVEIRLAYLESTGFLKDGELTRLGRMAAEINEGHALVMARAFADKVLHGCKPHDLVAILTSFVEGKNGVPTEPLVYIYKELIMKENLKSDPAYWSASATWCDPIHDWLEGHEFGSICEHYGVDAGSFVRTILKVANVVDEWVNLATFCEDLEMLETCRGLKEKLIRGLVVPDSLYLHV